jgi:4-alpha-glucanotransferase
LGNAALRFVDLLVDLKQRYWQVLPIGPTSFGDSQYQSLSAFAGNPYLIDLDNLCEEGLLTKEEIQSFEWGSDDRDIDYPTLFENRIQVLCLAFERFDRNRPEFTQFVADHTYWLEDYAQFMAIKTTFGNQAWTSWTAGLRNHEAETLDVYCEKLNSQIDFWKFTQYEFFLQWNHLKQYANTRGIQLIGDIPLYVAYDSVDVWADRERFQLDKKGNMKRVAGSPPDIFSQEGQKWGNPLYDWEKMESQDFDWWKKRMRLNGKLFDVLRIDHFLGIVKYYSIPVGEESIKGGKWNKGPGKKLTDAINSELGDCKIIAENVGVPIPGAKKLMNRIGWPGIKILMFAFDGDTANEYLPHNYTETNLVTYAGTHDNETIVGHFRDKTDYELAYLYEYMNISSKDEIPDAFIRLANGIIHA